MTTVVDLTIVTCNGCGRKREVYHDTPLVGTKAIVEWMQSPALAFLACVCGHNSCDMAHRLKK